MTQDKDSSDNEVWGQRAQEHVHELARFAAGQYGRGTADLTLLNLSENATFRADWSDGSPSTILRLHRTGYNSEHEIACELEWVRALRRDGAVMTPDVIPTEDGVDVGHVRADSSGDTHAHVMFEFCPGAEPSTEDMLTSMVRLGEINAAMHAQSRQWQPGRTFTRRTWDFERCLGDDPQWGRWEAGARMTDAQHDLLSRAVEKVRRGLGDYGSTPDRYGLVHADLRLANLLVAGDTTYVIDFDDCGYSWFLYDAATALTFLEDHDEAASWMRAWATGYERCADLAAADRAVMPTLVVLRRLLVLAWLGSHAQTEVARQESVAYLEGTCMLADTYLSGAMNWL